MKKPYSLPKQDLLGELRATSLACRYLQNMQDADGIPLTEWGRIDEGVRRDDLREFLNHLRTVVTRDVEVVSILLARRTMDGVETLLATNTSSRYHGSYVNSSRDRPHDTSVNTGGAPEASMMVEIDDGCSKAIASTAPMWEWLISHKNITFHDHVHYSQGLFTNVLSCSQEASEAMYHSLRLYVAFSSVDKIAARLSTGKTTRNFWQILVDQDIAGLSAPQHAMPQQGLRTPSDPGLEALRTRATALTDGDIEAMKASLYSSDEDVQRFHKLLKLILQGIWNSVAALRDFKQSTCPGGLREAADPTREVDQKKVLESKLYALLDAVDLHSMLLTDLLHYNSEVVKTHLKHLQDIYSTSTKESINRKWRNQRATTSSIIAESAPRAVRAYTAGMPLGYDSTRANEHSGTPSDEGLYDMEMERNLGTGRRPWHVDCLYWLGTSCSHYTACRAVYQLRERTDAKGLLMRQMIANLTVRIVDLHILKEDSVMMSLTEVFDYAVPTESDSRWIRAWIEDIRVKEGETLESASETSFSGVYEGEAILIALVILQKMGVTPGEVKSVLDIDQPTIDAFRVDERTLTFAKNCSPDCYRLIKLARAKLSDKLDIAVAGIFQLRVTTAMPPFLPAEILERVARHATKSLEGTLYNLTKGRRVA